MKKRLLSLFLSLCLVLTLVPGTVWAADDPVVTVTVAGTRDYDQAREVSTLVNEQRTENGLSGMNYSASLCALAMQRAAEIALYCAHELPDGTSWQDFAREESYFNGTTCAENIAMGHTSAAEVMEGWMNSDGHRANILDDSFTQIGVGCFEANGILCWVQLFSNASSDTAPAQTGRENVQTQVDILRSRLNLSPSGSTSLELEEWLSYSFTIRSTNPEFSSMKAPLVPTVTSSDDSAVSVQVAENGTVTLLAEAAGEATVSAAVYQGQTDPYTLNVHIPGDETQPTQTEPEPTVTEPEPTVTEPEPTETEPEPTVTEPEPTETEPEPTVTEPEPTDPEPTDPEPTEPDQCTNHEYGKWSVLEYPTSDHDGTKVRYCVNCGTGEYSGVMFPEDDHPDGFPVTVYVSGGGSYSLSINRAEAGHEVFLRVEPRTGYYLMEAYYGSPDTDDIPAPTVYGDIICFTMPEGELQIDLYFGSTKNPFVDVPESEYFYEPIMWAVNREITTGMDATHFGPNKSCTRAQVVTFLWRYFGCPEPQSRNNPFVDLDESEYYMDAVLWAVENGITTGMDATHFGPNRTCTRAQVVTFLWRCAGEPEYWDGYDFFVDVKSEDYFYDAVIWAVDYGITNGMDDTHFGPNKNCTRAHVVTFLYRAR